MHVQRAYFGMLIMLTNFPSVYNFMHIKCVITRQSMVHLHDWRESIWKGTITADTLSNIHKDKDVFGTNQWLKDR